MSSIVVYAPTEQADKENVVEFYAQSEEVMNQFKTTDIIMLLSDMHAPVGERRSRSAVWPCKLEARSNNRHT